MASMITAPTNLPNTSGSAAAIVHCPRCSQLLFKASLPLGVAPVVIVMKCPGCGAIMRWPDLHKAMDTT